MLFFFSYLLFLLAPDLAAGVEVKQVVGAVLEMDYKLPAKYTPSYFYEASTLHHDTDPRYSYHLGKYCNSRYYRLSKDCIHVASLKFQNEVIDLFKVEPGQLPEIYPSIDLIVASPPPPEPLAHKVMLRMANKECKMRTYVGTKTEFGHFIPFSTRSCKEDEDYKERLWVKEQWTREQEVKKRWRIGTGLMSVFGGGNEPVFLDSIKPVVGDVEECDYKIPENFQETYTSKCTRTTLGSTYIYAFSTLCSSPGKDACVNVVTVFYQNKAVLTCKVTSSTFTIATLNSIDIIVPTDKVSFGVAHRFILRMSDRRCLVRSLANLRIPKTAESTGLQESYFEDLACEDDRNFKDNFWVKEKWNSGHAPNEVNTKKTANVKSKVVIERSDSSTKKDSGKKEEGVDWLDIMTLYSVNQYSLLGELEDIYPFDVGVVEEFGYKKPKEFEVRKLAITSTQEFETHEYIMQSEKYCTKPERRYTFVSCVDTVTLSVDENVLACFKVSSSEPHINTIKSVVFRIPETEEEHRQSHQVTVINIDGECKVLTFRPLDQPATYKVDTKDCPKPPQTLPLVKPVVGEVSEFNYQIPRDMKEETKFLTLHPYDHRYSMVYTKNVQRSTSRLQTTCIMMLRFEGRVVGHFKMASCDVSRATWGSVDVILPKIPPTFTPSAHKVIVRKEDASCHVLTYTMYFNWTRGWSFRLSSQADCSEDRDYRENQWVREEWMRMDEKAVPVTWKSVGQGGV